MALDPPANPYDVWGSAAPPAGTPPKPQLIAYVDSTSVGFDLRLSLPPVCLQCGARDDISPLKLKLKIHGDLLARAAAFAQSGTAAFRAAVRPGDKIDLVLPLCARCHAARKKERNLAIAVLLAPVWIILLAVATAALKASLAGWAVLAGIAAFAALGLTLFVKHTASLKLERVDGDGIVRLGNVHPDAGQAIVDAASAAT
jgi:hypothetical protein